jgi:hypothetical protein
MNESSKAETPEQPKKPYTKPSIRRVELRPQEAVLGGCKTSGQTTPCQINPGSAIGT